MNDTDIYPLYLYLKATKEVIPLEEKCFIFGYNYHHYVQKKKLRKYPELIKYQKLIYMPVDMNMDIERCTRGFKTRWGIAIEEVVYLNV